MNKGTKFLEGLDDYRISERTYLLLKCRFFTIRGSSPLFINAPERFGEDGKYLLAIGRQYALLCKIEEAKYVKQAIKADVLSRLRFSMILLLIRCGRVLS